MMTKESFMIEEAAKEIVCLLMEDYNMDMQEAFHALYTSDTYSKLIDLRTGLFSQSTFYIYEYLERELSHGKVA